MTIISFEVDDDIVKLMGLNSVKDYLQKQISLLKLEYLSKEIENYIIKSELNFEDEMEKVREDVWKENKSKYLV